MYVGLWSRLEGFERDQLTRALERRRSNMSAGELHSAAATAKRRFAAIHA